MRADILHFLRCPACKGKLVLTPYKKSAEENEEILDGLLTCGCGNQYAVWRGVPRMFLPEVSMPVGFLNVYRDRLPDGLAHQAQAESVEEFSFSRQWAMFHYGALTWEQDLDERVNYFSYYIKRPQEEWRTMRILDAGCGNGTLSAALAACGAQVVAMDYSNSVEQAEANKKQFSGDNFKQIHYVQGDVQHPPFAERSFDIVYSDGVLHHTDSTKTSFDALAPLVKDEGRFFVWLYRTDLQGSYKVKEFLVDIIRAAMRPFPLPVVKRFCFLGAVILNTQLAIRRSLGFETRRLVPLWLKTLNLFDTFTPRYNHRHNSTEVRKWFMEQGFQEAEERTIPKLGHGGFGMLGLRPTAPKSTLVAPSLQNA